MNWDRFRKMYPHLLFTHEEIDELVRTGYVAVGVGDKDRKVYTVRIEVALSDIPEQDFSNGKRGAILRK